MTNYLYKFNHFNVIMDYSISSETINDGTYTGELSRYLEYTDEDLKKQYENNMADAKELPCLFLSEQNSDNPTAFIGHITNLEISNRQFSISFETDIENIEYSIITEWQTLFSIGLRSDYELRRTHWAIKKGNLLKIINDNFPSIYHYEPEPLIFLSWSGDSRVVAEAFKKLLLNAFYLSDEEVFVSSDNIKLGDDWWGKIKKALQKSQLGLIFVTKNNQERAWLNYEAGVLLNQFNNNQKIISVSTTSDFNEIDQNSPLRPFQFGVGIEKKQEVKKLLIKIVEILKISDFQSKNMIKKFDGLWDEFYTSVTGSEDSDYTNFRDMLNFWVKNVQKEWDSEGKNVSIQFSEIKPDSPKLDRIEKKIPDFSREFLKLNESNSIALKFNNQGKLKNPEDSCITWVPNKDNLSWFIKIIYVHNNQRLKVAYIDSQENKDNISLKKSLTECPENGREFSIEDLDLGKFQISTNVKALYESFLDLINVQT